MPAQTTDLFPLQDLEDSSRTGNLADSDLKALHTVADWIKTFVGKAQQRSRPRWTRLSLTAEGLERKTLWLAPEPIAGVWAGRFGESAVPALAGELRRTNWRLIEA
jgi:hypothetical protein